MECGGISRIPRQQRVGEIVTTRVPLLGFLGEQAHHDCRERFRHRRVHFRERDRLFVHVDLNRGTDAELLLIPGVDNAVLGVIKAGRPYKTFAQFETALGKAAKPADVQRIERYVFIPMELNTFTQEIIESFAPIGVGTRRWIREFNEYRPYTSMAQWEREISKYLRNNPNELKRLERYVYIEGQ